MTALLGLSSLSQMDVVMQRSHFCHSLLFKYPPCRSSKYKRSWRQTERCALLQVTKYKYMNVSTVTDARVHTNYVIQTGELPELHTHEEYMDVSVSACTL